jgi:hypothetical protein
MAKKRVKRAAKRRPAAKRRRPPKTHIEFRPVRRVVKSKIAELRKLPQTPQVAEAIGRMEECLAQVTQMCGENMLFPIA